MEELNEDDRRGAKVKEGGGGRVSRLLSKQERALDTAVFEYNQDCKPKRMLRYIRQLGRFW